MSALKYFCCSIEAAAQEETQQTYRSRSVATAILAMRTGTLDQEHNKFYFGYKLSASLQAHSQDATALMRSFFEGAAPASSLALRM